VTETIQQYLICYRTWLQTLQIMYYVLKIDKTERKKCLHVRFLAISPWLVNVELRIIPTKNFPRLIQCCQYITAKTKWIRTDFISMFISVANRPIIVLFFYIWWTFYWNTDNVNIKSDQLTMNDFQTVCSGTNYIDRNYPSTAFNSITDLIKSVNHTNIILICVLYRHDLEDYSHVNKKIKILNSKLYKLAKIFKHVSIIEVDNNRFLFTKQELHLNELGKNYYNTN
jgi:hypothetical protein